MQSFNRGFRLATLIGVALMASAAAYAHNGNQGAGVSGVVSVYGGTVSGSAASVSQGNAVTAAQVGGNGASYQSAWGNTGGTAAVGGTVNHNGSQVATSTTQYSNSNVTGSTVGNAPTMDGAAIANGGAAFGKTDTAASGTATFATGAIGGAAAIQGLHF